MLINSTEKIKIGGVSGKLAAKNLLGSKTKTLVMYPFLIPKMETTSKWLFTVGETKDFMIAYDEISISTQNEVVQNVDYEPWFSHWTVWTQWSSYCPSTIKYGSDLPTRKRKCDSTKHFYCIGAEDENNWIERKKCQSSCGELTDKDENCLFMENYDAGMQWLKTKCVSSKKVPTNGQHACGVSGKNLTLPVPMTISELQTWLSGYARCDFEFHSDDARLPVGLAIQDENLISLVDGGKIGQDFNLQTEFAGGWKKGISRCWYRKRIDTAGLYEKKCGPNGYCCSGSWKYNGAKNPNGPCPQTAIQFIHDNNLQKLHHCLREGVYVFTNLYFYSVHYLLTYIE